MLHHSNYWYGHKISDYGIEHKRVDFGTFAKAFDCVLNNEILQKTQEIGYWEQESGFIDHEEEIEELQEELEELEANIVSLEQMEEEVLAKTSADVETIKEKVAKIEAEIEDLQEDQDAWYEIFQYYIVSDKGAELLKEINEIVYYNDELDMYVWGVTHFGTSWDYVLTDIEIVDYSEN